MKRSWIGAILGFVFLLGMPLLGQDTPSNKDASLGDHSPPESIVWRDEFNGDDIDRQIWTYDVGGHGFGNGQLEYDTSRRENSYVKDGNLVIEARRENYQGKAFTSARMHTHGRFAFQYGELEARIRVPDTANGIWPAFWMLGNNFPAIPWPKCGEVDIFELGGKEGIERGLQHRRMNSALHFSGPDDKKVSLVQWFDAPLDLHRDYHLFKVAWTPKEMRFHLDGEEYASWDISAPDRQEYHQPHFPILNVAVGSWASSYTGMDTPDRVTAPFPAKMYVDWIRLRANGHTKVQLGQAETESGGFGIFTETTPVAKSLQYSDESDSGSVHDNGAVLYVWNNMAAAPGASASEGSECWSFRVAAGDWFGMGVFLSNHRNMKNYSNGSLHFDVQTTSPTAMKVGVKSARGDCWIPLGDTDAEFGFARDGKWHSVTIPLTRFTDTDFQTVHQVFMFAGDASSVPFTVSVDNVWWESGKTTR